MEDRVVVDADAQVDEIVDESDDESDQVGPLSYMPIILWT